MDDKSLEILEFPRIREILAGFTSFSASHELAVNLQPLSDYEQVSLLLTQSAEARHLLSVEPDFSIGGVVDIREAVKMAALGKMLEPRALLEIQGTIAAVCQLRGRLRKLAKELPLLWNIAEGIVELRQVEKDIGSRLAPTGELLDSASSKLATVRQRLRQAREQLLNRLEAVIKSPRGRKIIQEPIITEREGRYVIPVKVEFRKEIKGIVHDVSNTGATVFIEPWTTVELGNELRELVMEERREVERILRELSSEVGAHEAEISHSIDLVAELDLALAKARYADMARAAEPVLTTFKEDGKGNAGEQAGVLRLVEARHPLLAEKAVPLSVEMGRDFSVLVITGPNTGGKTVALKTIGLLSLMAQAGIPTPASAETCLPVFDSIFADIGDEQSIEQTLSTFSWHVGNIVRIIKSATEKSLVLLDELGTSTDPAEGSALARSILLSFSSRGTMTVATTHYGDLKAFAHTTPGLQNASLDFDPVTLMPTYHLTVGIPGGSNALATASRLGLPSEIIADAREMLSEGAQELETLLADLMNEKRRVEALHRDLGKARDEVEQRNTKLRSELQRLEAGEQKVIQETRDRVLYEAAELHKEIRQAASELRKEKSRERIEQARKAVAAVQEQLQSDVWQATAGGKTDEEAADESSIAPGDTVWLKEANLQATVLSVSEETRQIEVQAGRTRLSLNLDSVQKVVSVGGEATSQFIPVRRKLRGGAVSLELDLRGKRADEIYAALDRYLNDAYLANLGEVRIAHGFGTGTVRDIVRELLASHPLVKSFRAGKRGEGGDGATIAEL
ncbi:MAG: endonuclease MutS2 [Dehalococcoidia bacterium]|nr:endonuclease MutS2 [Dehalococcoidia bacterium]